MKLQCAMLTGLFLATGNGLAQKDPNRDKPAPKPQRLAVIVNIKNPVKTLSTAQIRALFLKKEPTWRKSVAESKTFNIHQKVRPVDSTAAPKIGEEFCAKVLKMSRASLVRYWIKAQYQSAIRPAKKIKDAERVIRFVGSFDGALGFVNESDLTVAARKKVKVVLRIEI